jgi:hypothetical protein
MPSAKGIQDQLSLAALYIEMAFGSTVLACGSGFLWRQDGETYLVTNWHNLAGRDPKTKQPISDTAGIPDRVKCRLWKDKVANGKGVAGVISAEFTFPLVDTNGKEIFLEHPLGSDVDIAALPLKLHPHVKPFYLNEHKFDEEISIYPGQDVFIVGFPLGLIMGQPLPVWKRGTVASEPYVPIDGVKKLLVDTATRKGMSGSFVVAQHTGIYTPAGQMTDDSWIGTGRKILGIYSGRLGASNVEAQVGIVWHRELIDEVIIKGVDATTRF